MSKKPIHFPCQFPIKIIGTASSHFSKSAAQILQKHVPDFNEQMLQSKNSKNNTYVSLTVTFEATSQEQLDALYQELSNEPTILTVL